MARLLFIRHGETDWNRLGKYTGQSDIPLNDTGIRQAKALASQLKAFPLAAVYSSDLERAVQTAEYALEGHSSLSIQLDSRLREIHQGVWEGMHFDDIKAKFAQQFAEREKDPLEVAPPGGESVGQLHTRVISAVQEIARRHAHQNDAVLISAHGLSIAIARIHYSGIPIDEVWDYIPSNAEIVEISVNGQESR